MQAGAACSQMGMSVAACIAQFGVGLLAHVLIPLSDTPCFWTDVYMAPMRAPDYRDGFLAISGLAQFRLCAAVAAQQAGRANRRLGFAFGLGHIYVWGYCGRSPAGVFDRCFGDVLISGQAMKWYWAILLTVIISGVMVALLQVGGTAGQPYVTLLVTISGIWAAGTSSSVGWGLFVFFLWPIGFPSFLIAQYKRSPDVA